MTATATKTSQHRAWSSVLSNATHDAYLAGLAHKPTPMVVYSPKVPFFDETPDLSQPVYHVPAGPCGFAWVQVSATDGPEGKEAHPGFRLPEKRAYDWGYDIWVSGFDQSVECKYAAALSLATALSEAVPGLTAWPMERLD